jgi:PAS domain S-box-containing protein
MGERPSGSLRQGLRNVSMPQFLMVAAPLTAVFVLGFFLEYRAQVGAEQARFFAQESAVIERGVQRVQRELEVAAEDLFFVVDRVTSTLDAADRDSLTALERDLLALVRSRSGLLRIRTTDTTGREILRVENASSGPRILPASELQSSGDRVVVSETLGLAVGEVFIAPMKLFAERGAIEEPPTPVLRLATPIDDAAGRRRGMIVLDAHGERFLRVFPRNSDAGGVQRMIVNADGYWLQHRPEVEWGFLLEHGLGFQRSFPEVWQQMLASRRGRLASSDGLFSFDAVPLRVPGASRETPGREARFWMLISLVPREILDGITVRAGTRLLVMAVPLYFALLGVAWLLAAARERRRAADEALRNLEYVRSSMMRAALDAIIVMDKTGTTLEFNPAAQQIFGYTLEEARGQLVADLIIPPARREAHRKGLERYLATGEGPLIDKHVTDLTAIRKDGDEFPVELTICPMMVAGTRLFCGFLRDLGEPRGVPAEPEGDTDIL